MMNGSSHDSMCIFLFFSLVFVHLFTQSACLLYPKTMQQNLLIQHAKKYVCWPRLLIIRFGIEVRLEPKIELWLVSQSTR